MTTISDVKALKETVDGHEAELNGAIRSLESHVSYLSSSSSWEDATLATLAEQKKLAAVVGPILAQTDAASATKTTLNSLDANAKAWLGKNMGAYWSAVLAEAQTNASLAVLRNRMKTLQLQVEGLASDVEAGLKKDEKPEELEALAKSVADNIEDAEELGATVSALVSDLEETYRTAVQTAAQDPASYDTKSVNAMNRAAAVALAAKDVTLQSLAERVAACEDQLEDIITRLGELEVEVNDLKKLLDLIQSVSFLSDHSSDYASAYYQLDPDNRTDDGCMKRIPEGTISLSYLIRPASAAAALTEENLWNDGLNVFGYYAQPITKAAVETFDLNVTNVEVDQNVPGLVTVTVDNAFDSEDFYFKKTGAKVALSITSGKTDITSKFVEIIPVDASGRKYVESISLTKLSLEVKKTLTDKNLKATVNPDDAYNTSVTWSSSDEDIATVDANGVVKAIAVGKAVITATSVGINEWGKQLTAQCEVEVKPDIDLVGPDTVEENQKVKINLQSANYIDPSEVLWRSSDEGKATVTKDEDGNAIVTGVQTTYNLNSNEYDSIYITCVVGTEDPMTLTKEFKVLNVLPKTFSISVKEGDNDPVPLAADATSYSVKAGKTITLISTINEGVDNSKFEIKYRYNNNDVAKVDLHTGVVTTYAGKFGTEPIQVRAENASGSSYLYPLGSVPNRWLNIDVQPYFVTGITIPNTTVAPGESATMTASFTSDGGDGVQPSDKTLTWTSDDPDLVNITPEGVLTANSEGREGTTTIRAITSGEHSVPVGADPVVGSCQVTVQKPVKALDVGYYFYDDGDWSETYDSNKNLVGIVFYVGNPTLEDLDYLGKAYPQCTHGLVVSTVELSSKFGGYQDQTGHISGWGMSDYLNANYVGTSETVINGFVSTEGLKAYRVARGTDYVNVVTILDSAELPNESASVQDPTATPWYIPSYKEMTLLKNNLSKVNASLSSISKSNINSSGYYWTSSFYVTNNNYKDYIANPFDMSTGSWKGTSNEKDTQYPVRVVLAF